jgi:glycosyltransferase involved in cell wall biosynthesis
MQLVATHPGEPPENLSCTECPESGCALELTIVMPCLNEAETLAACIRKAQSYLHRSGVRGEIVIGDNGSTDGSQAIAGSLGARVIEAPVRGYGAALQAAIRHARGSYCIMGDSDDSYDFENLDDFVQNLRQGYEVVMGNRFRGGIKPGAMPWKNRYIGNPVLSSIGRLLFRAQVGDFHCGLRGFSKRAIDSLDLRTTGMEYASEMVIKAKLKGLKMTEVPTTLSPDGRSRPPHLLPFRDGWRHLRFMLTHYPHRQFFYSAVSLLAAGLAVAAWLLSGTRHLDGIGFGHPFAFVSMLLCSHLVGLAVFTRIFVLPRGG